MKKLVIILFISFLSSTAIFAQESKPVWITVKSANLKCWECKERLEKYLIVENKTSMDGGVIQWKFFLLQGEIKFQYYPDRVTPDMIRTTLNNAGFDADNELATEDSYKLLPPICKRVTDGGGPQLHKPCHLGPLPN